MPIPARNKGTIAILRDDIPAAGAASSPEYLASALEDGGYQVRFVSADDLCSGELMRKDNFDVLVLPYGGSYPAMGRDALISYLKDGGNFLSMGGYAFDNLLIRSNGQWKPLSNESASSPSKPQIPPNPPLRKGGTEGGSLGKGGNEEDADIRINTRKGEARDSLGLHPDQIGVFDPSYPLERVSYIEAAPGQFIFDSEFRIEGEFEGYAASSMAGSNSPVFPQRYGRWIPLLHARDAYGRLRGSAGAMVHNYAGPYAGSSWAYFGVTNYDLFAPRGKRQGGFHFTGEQYQAKERNYPKQVTNAANSKPMPASDGEMAKSPQPPLQGGAYLLRLVDSLIDKRFITELSTELACYRPGEESVKISVAGPTGCNVSLEIYADGDETPVFESREEFTDGAAEVSWSPVKFESDFYRIEARLLADGQTADMTETGFVVWNGKVISEGFPLKFSGNYFRDGDRSVFLSGTNQTGMMFASANENPLVWKRDLEKMSDHGVNILRILHFSPFVVSHTGHPRAEPKDLNVDALPKKLERQLDAIVQLCQKYKVILFLSLHDWMGVELSDEELAAQRKFAQVVASRYRNVPGIMYDVQNEPTVRLSNQPDIRREFNNYLEERYGSTEALRAAWRRDPPARELGNVDVSPGSEDWDDIKAFDVNYFKTIILSRWVKANADGVRAGDLGRPLTVGYLPWMHPADKILGTEHVDFSNMHFYGDPRDFPRQLKLIDRRFEGKSFSLGEFGAKVHPTWRLGGSITTMKGGIDWFLRVGHYALGMGASFIANWDWKDMPDCVFPWGINHPCDVVPKDILLAYRSQSMFFRNIQPRYEEPELYFLVSDSHRLGGQAKRVTEAILSGIDLLLGCHVDFGVINEYSLHKLPESAKAIIYPIPFCPSDETYHQVRNFVWNGGVLYLSGDISYDQYRNRTRQDRLEELCGVRYVGERYPNIAGSHEPGPCIQVTPTTADVLSRSDDAWPVTMTNSFGKGHVFYCADPIEFHASSPDIYRDFLDFAGVKRIPLEPDDPSIRAFRLPTETDETVYVLFNESGDKKQVTLKIGTEPITLSIGAGKPGLIEVTGPVAGTRHTVSLLESQGRTTVGSETLMDANCHVMIAALDGQGIDRSKSLMVLPIEPGHLRIATQMDWKSPIVGVGDIRSGEWRCLDKIEPELLDGCLSFRINQLQSLNILLIAEADSPLIKGD